VAEEPQEEVHEEVPGAGASNRTVFVIMAVIAALFLLGGVFIGKTKEEEMPPPPAPPGNARALVLPSDDAARTVVVAPCNTDPEETADDAREDRATPNTVRFEFPRGGGDRALLVPDCSPKAGVSGSNSGLPAAAFVLPVGSKENRLQMPLLRAESQALVPQEGKAKTVVISPCTGQLGGEAGKPAPSREGGDNQDAVLEPEEGQGDLVVAPLC
jgi:hypothetical protein